MEAWSSDENYLQVKESLCLDDMSLKYMHYRLEEDGIIWCNIKIYVLERDELKKIIQQDMHNVPYAFHSGY